jgi:monoamine oxidase
VLGGGLAGLAALDFLTRARVEALVLEARRRPGGRVLTLRAPFEHGQYAEAGAIYVPGSHDVTRRYVAGLGLELVPARPPIFETARFLRGKLLWGRNPDWPLELTDEERAAGLRGLYQRYVEAGREELGDLVHPDLSDARIRHLDEISFAELLRERGASEAAIELVTGGFYEIFGDGAATVSALSVLQDTAGFESSRIVGGSARLPEGLAARHANRIRYGVEILSIEQDARSVRVLVREGSGPRVLEAEHAVCTLPPPVLTRLPCTPGWSSAKRAALDAVTLTSVTRVYLQARRRFWQRGKPLAGLVTDRPIQGLQDSTLVQPGEAGILEAYTTGKNARSLSARDDAGRRAFVLREVESIFPGASAEITGGTSYAWHEDPYAGGGYAWFEPGEITRHRAPLGSAEGRVHFAGEHTSVATGWMQGALESGERAAGEIVAAAATRRSEGAGDAAHRTGRRV